MNIIQKQNNKLFYKKYAYRFTVVLTNAAYACKNILHYLRYDDRYHKVKKDLVDRFTELHYICKDKDIIVRVESSRLSIYTSDKELLDTLCKMYWWHYEVETSTPKNQQYTEYLLANKDVILSPDMDGFKATIGPVPYNEVVRLKSWADSQPFILARSIQYKAEGYIIFSDEKYLTMLILNGNIKIRKIEKIVKEDNIA